MGNILLDDFLCYGPVVRVFLLKEIEKNSLENRFSIDLFFDQ